MIFSKAIQATRVSRGAFERGKKVEGEITKHDINRVQRFALRLCRNIQITSNGRSFSSFYTDHVDRYAPSHALVPRPRYTDDTDTSLQPPADGVSCLAFSPDSSRLLVASWDSVRHVSFCPYGLPRGRTAASTRLTTSPSSCTTYQPRLRRRGCKCCVKR